MLFIAVFRPGNGSPSAANVIVVLLVVVISRPIYWPT